MDLDIGSTGCVVEIPANFIYDETNGWLRIARSIPIVNRESLTLAGYCWNVVRPMMVLAVLVLPDE